MICKETCETSKAVTKKTGNRRMTDNTMAKEYNK